MVNYFVKQPFEKPVKEIGEKNQVGIWRNIL